MFSTNNRVHTLVSILFSIIFIAAIIIISLNIPADNYEVGFAGSNEPMSLVHPFGTDWLGRDMFARTMKGLQLSTLLALMTAAISTLIAVILGALSALGGKIADHIVSWVIDLFMGMPHLVFMILIAFVAGGGFKGVILGVGLTHWPVLARIVRSQIMKVRGENYIAISRQMGMSKARVFLSHILPHLLPHVLIGFVLLFPHVILHEAGLSFLGFGLSPAEPALGIILSEGMKNISTGRWWLVLLPTLLLVVLAKSFDNIGERLTILLSPATAQR